MRRIALHRLPRGMGAVTVFGVTVFGVTVVDVTVVDVIDALQVEGLGLCIWGDPQWWIVKTVHNVVRRMHRCWPGTCAWRHSSMHFRGNCRLRQGRPL